MPTSHLSAATPPPSDIPADDLKQAIAPAEAAGTRADRFLAGALEGLSRSRVKALIQAGQVTRDGQTLSDPSEAVPAGVRYVVRVPQPSPRRRRRRPSR